VAWAALYQRQESLGKKCGAVDNAPMRVAMLSYHTCPLATLGGKDTGGMNVYVRELTRELGRQGVGVDVFTRSQDEHVPHVLHDLGYGNRVVHVTAGPEVPLARPQLSEHLTQFVHGILDFASAKGLHYDLIHSHYWLSGLAALELRQAWGVPIVHMFHTLAVMKERVARRPEEVEPSERHRAEIRLLREVDAVMVATRAELAQFLWLYKVDTSNVTVIPPGVDTSHFYPIPLDEAREYVGVPPERKMVLFVGRIEPLKGIDTLLEAVALLKKQGFLKKCPLWLAIIGGEPDVDSERMTQEMARLKGMRQQTGLDDSVTFLGSRSQDTLPYYYSAAEVVVVPSHYESFGLVALEAMACGVPVVASETGGLVYLVKDGETGFHVPAGDAAALAQRLREVIEDRALRARLGNQAAEYARDYAWPVIAERVLALYKQLLSRN
jgi:D-inositol-3-phosphate glycosyltransferase